MPYGRSLYRVFWHFSSLGNEITAYVYFYALMGKTKFYLDTLSCEFNSKGRISFTSTENINLDNVKKIFTGTKNTLLGELRRNSTEHDFKKENGSFFKYKSENIKSLLGFSDPSVNDYGQSPYFPVSFELNSKTKVFIQFSNGKHILPGQIKKLDISGKLFNFYSSYLRTRYTNNSHYEVCFLKEKLPESLKKS